MKHRKDLCNHELGKYILEHINLSQGQKEKAKLESNSNFNTIIRIVNLCSLKLIKKMKKKKKENEMASNRLGTKYLQQIYLKKKLYPEHLFKNSSYRLHSLHEV